MCGNFGHYLALPVMDLFPMLGHYGIFYGAKLEKRGLLIASDKEISDRRC